MKKSDLKTGMTCKIAKGNTYMIYVNPENDIFLIPVSGISGLNSNVALKTTKMNENLIQELDSFVTYGFYNNLDPYQIMVIYYSKSPLNLFSFKQEDIIWRLNEETTKNLK